MKESDDNKQDEIEQILSAANNSQRRSSRVCKHSLLKKVSLNDEEKLCDRKDCIITGFAWHCVYDCDYDLCENCCPANRRFVEEEQKEQIFNCEDDDGDTSVDDGETSVEDGETLNTEAQTVLDNDVYTALKDECYRYGHLYEKCLLYLKERLNISKHSPYLIVMYDSLDIANIILLFDQWIRQEIKWAVIMNHGVEQVELLVNHYNKIDYINWNVEIVLNGYEEWKIRFFNNLISGRFQLNYIEHKKTMSKGWRLEHEIFRQFDIDPSLYHGIHQFLALYTACYAHMGTEIPCEGVAKKVKKLIKYKEAQSRVKTKHDLLIGCNGPSLMKCYQTIGHQSFRIVNLLWVKSLTDMRLCQASLNGFINHDCF